jgi:hypothetical protein
MLSRDHDSEESAELGHIHGELSADGKECKSCAN